MLLSRSPPLTTSPAFSPFFCSNHPHPLPPTPSPSLPKQASTLYPLTTSPAFPPFFCSNHHPLTPTPLTLTPKYPLSPHHSPAISPFLCSNHYHPLTSPSPPSPPPHPHPDPKTGKYLLVKDPNKELLRLYAVPEDAFETNYTEEPLAEADEVPADSAVPTAAGAAEEGGDE